MKTDETIKDYMIGNVLNIEKIINQYSGYVYSIVNNLKSPYISNEDIEEVISDVFLAIWKNSKHLDKETSIKPYLAGIARNIISKKYRTTLPNYAINDEIDKIVYLEDIEKVTEENAQDEIIRKSLKLLKREEYQIFIMFYYESKKIKEIAENMKLSQSKVKVILHRVRKEIRKNLKEGGYGYGE